MPIEPAEALAQSLSALDDPFAPPPEPQPPGGSLDSLPPPAPAPQEGRAEEERGTPLDLVGPLDVQSPGDFAAAGQDLRAPAGEIERLLGGGTGLSLSQTPGLALERTPGLALDRDRPALDRDPGPSPDRDMGWALDRDLAEPGHTPAWAAGADAVAGGAVSEAPAPGPSRRANDLASTSPAAAATNSGGAARLEREQAPVSAVAGEAHRPKTSAPAAAFSLAFLVAAAAVTFVAWRGSMSTHPGQVATTRIGAEQVAAGPYDTAAGTTVLVVHGQVKARERVAGPVQVEAQLWDHGNLVATAEGAAGAGATPEEVHAAGTPGDAEALRRALDRRAARGLAAGESAPFLIVFPPPAPAMRGLELRVVASAAAGAR